MNHAFYRPRTSGLHALHPLTKIVLVFAILLVGFLARSPHIPFALYTIIVLPLAIWGKIARDLLKVTFSVILPLAVSLALVQGLFFPGASLVLWSVGPLAVKVEGLALAYHTAGRLVLLAGGGLLLLFSTHPADIMLALEERGMPGALAYVVVAAIQLVPQTQLKAAGIVDAQRARGLETEGPLLTRVRAVVPLLAPLVFGALADVDERAMALEGRAFSAPCKKTSFRELRDADRQRIARWLLGLAALGVAAAEVWGL